MAGILKEDILLIISWPLTSQKMKETLPKSFKITLCTERFSPRRSKESTCVSAVRKSFPRSLLTPSITHHQQDVYLPTPCC